MEERKVKHETGIVNKISVLMYSYRKKAAAAPTHTRAVCAASTTVTCAH
jgi:hypothetical protein